MRNGRRAYVEKEIFRAWIMIVSTARGNARKEHALADAMSKVHRIDTNKFEMPQIW